MDCIFCKIANRDIPSEIVYEDKDVLGFENVKPEAPIHLLFIPKKHIKWKDEFADKEIELFGQLISVVKKIAIERDIFQACKIIFNLGKTGHIPHIHLHLIGGWKKGIPMSNVSKD